MCLISQNVQSTSRKYVVTYHRLAHFFLRAALHIMLMYFCTYRLVFLIAQRSFKNRFQHPLNYCKWTELTGILLGCCSRISLTSSTLCSVGQKNRLWLNGNIQSRSSTVKKTQMRSETKQIQAHGQRQTALLQSALLIPGCTDQQMRLHSYK